MKVVSKCIASTRANPDPFQIWLNWSTSIHHPTWPRYLAFNEHIVTEFAAVIDAGRKNGDVAESLDSDDAARMMVGQAHTSALMVFSGLSEERIILFAQHYIDGALHFKS